VLQLRNVHEDNFEKTETLEVHYKAKRVTAAHKTQSILLRISANKPFNSSKHTKALASQREYVESIMRLKYENKLTSGERRRVIIQQLENMKKEVVRTRRDNVYKTKKRVKTSKAVRVGSLSILGMPNEDSRLNSDFNQINLDNIQAI